MRKITLLLLSSLLLLGSVACSPSSETASDTNTTQPDQGAKADATNQVRKDQLNSDIRAREERNKAVGDETVRADTDLASEVRSKLEANIPAGKLNVAAKDGVVTVSGNVAAQDQVAKVDKLAKEIKGVKSVVNQTKVATTKAPTK